ncbi:unnamed protein product [Peniophora sp. CBMAI 1063]|nr:unnamed protein product [Peniophora sp. CBMAI 1063]
MPKTSTDATVVNTEQLPHEPHTKTPLMLRHNSRKILVPRLANYEAMVKISKNKIRALRYVAVEHLTLTSTTVPGFEGEKAEISKELWPEVVDQLRTFDVQRVPESYTGFGKAGYGMGVREAPGNFIVKYEAFLTRWGISEGDCVKPEP